MVGSVNFVVVGSVVVMVVVVAVVEVVVMVVVAENKSLAKELELNPCHAE